MSRWPWFLSIHVHYLWSENDLVATSLTKAGEVSPDKQLSSSTHSEAVARDCREAQERSLGGELMDRWADKAARESTFEVLSAEDDHARRVTAGILQCFSNNL